MGVIRSTINAHTPLLPLPAELAICFGDRLVIDASVALSHVAVLIELQVFVAMAASSLADVNQAKMVRGLIAYAFKVQRDLEQSPSNRCPLQHWLWKRLGKTPKQNSGTVYANIFDPK